MRPDLTAFAKIIGGGFPVGAFGGRTDIMSLFDPRQGKIGHGGTFNGNAVTMAAGRVAMEQLTPQRIAHANALGDTLRQGLADVLAEQRIHGQVTGLGSLLGVCAIVFGKLWRDAHFQVWAAVVGALVIGAMGGGLNAVLAVRKFS